MDFATAAVILELVVSASGVLVCYMEKFSFGWRIRGRERMWEIYWDGNGRMEVVFSWRLLVGVSVSFSSLFVILLTVAWNSWFMLTLRTALLAMIQRTRVRKSYKIEGNIADDCLRSCCCCCCAIIQDEKEICFRELCAQEDASGVPYMAPDGMSYAPPPK